MAEVETSGVPIPEGENAFMSEHNRCFMVTFRRDGSPTIHPMGGFFGGGLWLNMYNDSQKAFNLRRNASITCLMTTASDDQDFRGVIYRGLAREMTPEESMSDGLPLGAQNARAPHGFSEARTESTPPSSGDPDDPEEARLRLTAVNTYIAEGKRILFEIVPDEIGFLDQHRDKE